MSDLPNEIIARILVKFPARSLVRLTVVCKQWKSVISDPVFIKDHANHATSDQSSLHRKLITHWTKEGDGSLIHSVISQSIDYESLNSLKFELCFETSIAPAVLGSCNGLLLVGIYDLILSDFNTRLIWNPLFSKMYRVLPQHMSVSSHRTRLHGFGYAGNVDDYKVVILNKNMSSGREITRYSEIQVEVYSLKTNSWKIIPGIPSTDFVCTGNTSRAGICVRESIYWIVRDTVSKNVVISFDLKTEKFKLIETPWGDDTVRRYRPPLNLVDVSGYLGAYRSDETVDETEIWIWYEDENKKGIWTEILRIPTKYQIVKQILAVMNYDEVLLQVIGPVSQNLLIYDSESMMFWDMPCGNHTWPVYMVETLVSPVSS